MTTTEDIREEFQALVERLETQRDEIKVQVHLANMEAHDEWRKLEVQWQQLQAKSKQLGKEVGRTSHEAFDSLLELSHELREGYKRIGKLF